MVILIFFPLRSVNITFSENVQYGGNQVIKQACLWWSWWHVVLTSPEDLLILYRSGIFAIVWIDTSIVNFQTCPRHRDDLVVYWKRQKRTYRSPHPTKTTVGKPRTDSVPPTMQSQIPKSRDVTLFLDRWRFKSERHALFTSTLHVFLLNIFINKTERSIHFYWIHFLNKILTWLTREYVYLWYRLLEINVGARDTAADEMLTKNGATNPFLR